MNRIFEPKKFITVPDGSEVSAFLNATDASQEDVPWRGLEEMSVVAGRLQPGVSSWIHVHPAVTQITCGVSGTLSIWMCEAKCGKPYSLDLQPGQAVVSEPGTLFQLVNDTSEAADVLYIVSPSYVFEMDGDEVIYDDAILVAKTWDQLNFTQDHLASLQVTSYEACAWRADSLCRLATRRGHGPSPLAREDVHSLHEADDYMAPDGSEIRLLAEGEHGRLAHCVLPAGRVTVPVRHRTTEELCYVLKGNGEIWRRSGDDERVDAVRAGDSFRLPVGTPYQIRAGVDADLNILRSTMPPWPGAQEAVPSQGRWPAVVEPG